MTEPFRFSDEQWSRLEAIVARAKGNLADFKGYRHILENGITSVGLFSKPILDGLPSAEARIEASHIRVRNACAELRDALSDFSDLESPLPISIEVELGKGSFNAFKEFLFMLEQKTAQPIERSRKRSRLGRDLYWQALATFWQCTLRLKVAIGKPSLTAEFIAVASEGILDTKADVVTNDAIRGVLRKFKETPLDENPFFHLCASLASGARKN